MSNMATHPLLAGLSPRHNPLEDHSAAAFVKEQSFRANENTSTDLVIQTKEGDLVTLRSSSFSQIDAFSYDSRGVVQTETGVSLFNHNEREITLQSGQSFSYSVAGDLNEEEREDIDAILQGLDEILSDMSKGEMSSAIDKALDLGDFDSVSAFSADLQYQRSYEISSAASAAMAHALPAQETNPGHQAGSSADSIPAPPVNGPGALQGKNKGPSIDFNKFIDKLTKHLESHDNKKFIQAHGPMNKLLQHHIDDLENGVESNDAMDSLKDTLQSAMKKIQTMMEDISDMVLGKQLEEQKED